MKIETSVPLDEMDIPELVNKTESEEKEHDDDCSYIGGKSETCTCKE